MSDITDEHPIEFSTLARELRHRLESLRRAGIDRMPTPSDVTIVPRVRPNVQASRIDPEIVSTVRLAPPAPVTQRPPVLPAASLFGNQDAEIQVLPIGERPGHLETLRAEVASCTKCATLAASRTQTVFGVGSASARLMFIGEAPGADEDRTGVPFVGKSGQLLTDMITKGMGMTRDEVYIANVLKSRPPGNRDPLPEEVANCLPFLERQIAIVRPEFLCILGRVAASTLLETALPLGKLRGRWHRYRGIPTVVTYHPSFLLRTPAMKKEAWDDLQMLDEGDGCRAPGP